MNLEKPKSLPLVASDVATNIKTLLLWCCGSSFGVSTLNSACSYNFSYVVFNVATLSFDVATLQFGFQCCSLIMMLQLWN